MVGLFVIEPSIMTAPDYDAQHFAFATASLTELRERLRRRGGELLVRVGECPSVLEQVAAEVSAAAIWAHEETGNLLTYARDRRVRAWARAAGIAFREFPHGGVVRRLATRDGWAEHWASVMQAPHANPPTRFAPLPWVQGAAHPRAPVPGEIPSAAVLGIRSHAHRTQKAEGGERAAHALLKSFLQERGVDYRRAMSSPATAFDACSRISAHLAFGTLSGRQAWRAAQRRLAELDADPSADPRWRPSVRAFVARLAWRDHFMQKLESEPQIESKNFSPAYDGLRPNEPDSVLLAAWLEGQTGYPMVDACMRALRAEGWINFRMRAMLVSFASYHLWLPWQATAVALAPHFLDYEPGIHYSQFQMQSGTTGINSIRIYNPYKQGLDQDPTGAFVRAWVPELANVSTDFVHAPHEMPSLVAGMCGVQLGRDYPWPIVDHASAYRTAKELMFAARQTLVAQTEARRVYDRHGSRKEPLDRRRR